MQIKASQFLKNGAVTLLAACAFASIVANPAHDTSSMSPSIDIPAQMLIHLSDGLDYISYQVTGNSVTQDTETYRYNVMKNLLTKNMEKEIQDYGRFTTSGFNHVNDNLKAAKELGVFKDAETFDGEMKILKENNSVKDPLSLENLVKLVKDGEPLSQRDPLTSNLIEEGHYDGVQNIEEAKQNVLKNIEKIKQMRETNANSMENTLKNRIK